MTHSIAVKDNADIYLGAFSDRERKLAGDGLLPVRREAMERFMELGFPTTRIEDWKYTNVAPIARTRYAAAPAVASAAVAELLKNEPFADLGCPRLVFVNGRFNPELSTASSLSGGMRAGNLAALWEQPEVARQLAQYAPWRDRAFVAMNTALFEDAAFVYIPKRAVVDTPLHLLFVTAGEGETFATYPRVLIVAERESQAQVIESYIGLRAEPYFTNTVTELVVEEGAILEHYKLEQESLSAYHVSWLQTDQKRTSRLTTHSVATGGEVVRNDVVAVMDGEGAECVLNGLYVTGGNQHVDNHTALDHAQPHCSSREYYKGVLDGASTGVFNGGIIVRQDAQKTDAIQSNKNLLLSPKAAINTKPQLQIWADDVRCTHGATIGQLDSEALFYLRARGIGLAEARSILTYAFANDVLQRMQVAAVRERLEKALFAALAGGAT